MMNRTHTNAQYPQPVEQVLEYLDLVVTRALARDPRQRYFWAVVQPRQASRQDEQYFLKVAFATPLVVTLLQREIQMLLTLRELGIPAVKVFAHNAEPDNVNYRFGLYELLEAEGRSGFAETSVQRERLQSWHARAVVDTLCQFQDVNTERLASLRPSLHKFSWTFEEWYEQIVVNLNSPVAPDASGDRPYPTLGDALRGADDKPFTDQLLGFAASLEPAFKQRGSDLLIHGDCAPGNTFWREDGTAILLDWEWSGIAPTPWSLPAWGLDIANYYTRAWENPAFGHVLLKEYLHRKQDTELNRLAIRAAFIDQTLNKLHPFYTYNEEYWQATKAINRYKAISAILYRAVTDTLFMD